MRNHTPFAILRARAGLAACAGIVLCGGPATGQQTANPRPSVILHQQETATEPPAEDVPGLRRQVRTLQRDLSGRDKERANLQKALDEARQKLAELGEASLQLKAKLNDALESEKAAISQARRQEKALEQAMLEAEKMRQELETAAEEAKTQQAFFDESARETEVLRELLSQQTGADDRPAPRTDGILGEAHQRLAEGELEKAADLFRQGAARWPDDPAYPVGLASCHYAAGRYTVAKAMLEKMLDRDDDQAEAQGLLGLVLWQEDDLRQAERRLTRAARGQPDNERWQVYLGMVQYARGRQGAAQEAFENAIRINPMNPEAHFNLAILLAGQDEPDRIKARVHYEQALRLGSLPDPALEKLVPPR